jgi:TRAP-type C4-dicarboxylate transport system permease small subunit
VSSSSGAKPHQSVPASWPLPLRLLAGLSTALATAEGAGIALCLGSVILLSTWQFVDRNLTGLHVTAKTSVPEWVDGVIRHAVFMLGFLGGAFATYTGRHIRIDAVTRLLGPRPRMMLRVLTTAAALGVVFFLGRASHEFYKVTLEEAGEASQHGQLFTSSRGALIMVVGYGVIGFHFLVQLLIDVGWLLSKAEPPAEWVAEASHGEAPPVESVDGAGSIPTGGGAA